MKLMDFIQKKKMQAPMSAEPIIQVLMKILQQSISLNHTAEAGTKTCLLRSYSDKLLPISL